MATISEPLVVYDIGARGRLQPHWDQFAQAKDERFRFVLFDPDPQAAAELRDVYADNPLVTVVEKAALHRAGTFDLHITRHATCSSILEPDFEVLGQYAIAPIFEVVRKVAVDCDRLDTIRSSENLPRPDFMKIDVQGAEYLVLSGMGDLLGSCLGLELETHFYPIYRSQRVLGDIVALLADYGLRLFDLRPQRHFDFDYVEANAMFSRSLALPGDPASGQKLALIREVMGLEFHPHGTHIGKMV